MSPSALPSTTPSAKSVNWRAPFTDESWSALEREFERVARAYCAAGAGRLFKDDVKRMLHVGDQTATRLIAEAVRAGWLVARTEKTGYSVVGVVPAEDTLASLLAFARRHKIAESQSPKGRQRTEGVRAVHGLTPSQLAKAATAAAFVAECVTGDKHNLAGVGSDHFEWLENGGPAAAGVWALVARVDAWAVREGLSPATREAHLAGVRNLLDLCATKGRLARGPRPAILVEVEAAEWREWITGVVQLLAPFGGATKSREAETGARVLARFATRRGWLEQPAVDWAAVVNDILDAHQRDGDRLSSRDYTAARRVYRRLRELGRIVGPEFGRSVWDPIILVPTAVAVRSASSHDFSGWTTRAGEPATKLATDLSRWCRWADKRLGPGDLEGVTPPLPARERVDPTPSQQARAARRKRADRPEFLLSLSVLERTVHHLAEMAGWASDHANYNPSTQGLAALVDPELFNKRVTAWLRDHGRDPVSGRSASLAIRARALGTIASPFLEREALLVGDAATAARFRTWGAALQVRAIELEPGEDDRDDALDKVRLWELDGTDGYPKLEALVDVLETVVVAEGDGRSVDEQIEGLRAGTFRPRRPVAWAVAVRDLIMLNLVRRVPLRGANLAGLRIASTTVVVKRRGAEITVTKPAHWRTSDPDGCLYLGAISVHFEKEEVKQRRSYDASYITPREVGRPDAERAVRRRALELYLMSGGAREELLRRADGTVAASPFLLPGVARLSSGATRSAERAARGYAWSRVGASNRFAELLRLHGRRVGVDIRLLREVHGAAGLHVVRHLFGTYFVKRRRVKLASLMLGHRNTTITEEVYAGISTVGISVDEMQREQWRDEEGHEDEPGSPVAAPPRRPAAGLASELLELAGLLREGLIDRQTYDLAVLDARGRHVPPARPRAA